MEHGAIFMKSVGSYEAKTHLPRLLSQVEKGETITKRGKPIAVLAPVPQQPRRDVKSVIEAMLAFRDEHGPVPGDDLTVREMIEEGRP
jgi:prevent-host-death family protein